MQLLDIFNHLLALPEQLGQTLFHIFLFHPHVSRVLPVA